MEEKLKVRSEIRKEICKTRDFLSIRYFYMNNLAFAEKE